MDFFTPILVVAVFATACFILTFLIRRMVETGFPGLKVMKLPADEAVKGTPLEASKTTGNAQVYSSKMAVWWNEVILYAIAPAWGGLFGYFMRTSEFFPPEIRSWHFAIMFGVAIGFMCSFFFKVIKKIFMDKAGITSVSSLPSDNPPPPAG